MNDGARALELLSLVHQRPGITRAEAARQLGIGTGQATEITARLVARELVGEAPAAPSGARGRPSSILGPNRNGPLVLCIAIDHEAWQVAVAELGSRLIEVRADVHDRQAAPTLVAVKRAATALRRVHRARIVATAVSVPGTVRDDVVLQASGRGWTDVSLDSLRPRRSATAFVAGNDATFAAIAEAHRGVGVGYRSMLHLFFDAGVGGAIVEDGRAVTGASGVAGEFGHLPFSDPKLRCPCGACGCWNLTINAASFARHLARRPPRSEVSFVAGVLAAARAGDASALDAVQRVAADVGRGTAGLVNALDPALVSFGGYGADLLELARVSLEAAYQAGLMSSRRRNAPELVAGALGGRAPLIGAAEEGFDRALFLAPSGLLRAEWAAVTDHSATR
jgi:predicted NBD/HSP70 family sugar kinase